MSEHRQPVDGQIQHYASVLRQAIRAAGLSVTEVERRLGIGPKALRRVLCGEVDLKFRHMLDVLGVIGMSEEEFFAIAMRGRRRQRTAAGGLLAKFKGYGYQGEFVPNDDDLFNPTPEEFERHVKDAVNKALHQLAKEGALPPLANDADDDREEKPKGAGDKENPE